MDFTQEEWRAIKGYEGMYEVSSHGRVKSLKRMTTSSVGRKPAPVKERILSGGINLNGYRFLYLCKYGKLQRFYVHRLVALTFIDNPHNYPNINHKDENRLNNCVENLEWCTQKYNVNYGGCREKIRMFNLSDKNPNRGRHRPEKFKEKVRKPIIQLDRDGNVVNEWDSAKTAGATLGIFPQQITAACKKKILSYKNYIWKYKYDYPHTDPAKRKEIP